MRVGPGGRGGGGGGIHEYACDPYQASSGGLSLTTEEGVASLLRTCTTSPTDHCRQTIGGGGLVVR